MTSEKSLIIRVPKWKVIKETDEYFMVDFGDIEEFIRAIGMAYCVSDEGKCVVMKEEER